MVLKLKDILLETLEVQDMVYGAVVDIIMLIIILYYMAILQQEPQV
jgi:hypothetical protein